MKPFLRRLTAQSGLGLSQSNLKKEMTPLEQSGRANRGVGPTEAVKPSRTDQNRSPITTHLQRPIRAIRRPFPWKAFPMPTYTLDLKEGPERRPFDVDVTQGAHGCGASTCGACRSGRLWWDTSPSHSATHHPLSLGANRISFKFKDAGIQSSAKKGELGAVVVHVFHVFYLFLPHYMGMQFVQKNNKERTHMILQVVIVWQAIFQEIDHMVFKM